MHICVTGSLAYDFIMDFPDSYENHILPDKIKTLSVSFLVQNLNRNFGGVAGNIAYTMALLKTPPTILGSLGAHDATAYNTHFDRLHIATTAVTIVPNEFTANAFIITDKNNCQIAGFYPGAMINDMNLSLEPYHQQSPIDFLVIAPTVPDAMEHFVQQAKKHTIPYLYDPAQQIPRLTKLQLQQGIDGAAIVIGNDYELELVQEKTGWRKKDILQKTKLLITTLGENGSLIETQNETIPIGIAKPKQVTDPTGAGDAYIAGFIYGYLQNKDLKVCGQLGAVASSFAIEQYGTQSHTFTKKELMKRYKENFV